MFIIMMPIKKRFGLRKEKEDGFEKSCANCNYDLCGYLRDYGG